MIYPDFDKKFTLATDASDFAIGAVLSQEKDGFDHPIAYLSRTLNGAERNYSVTEKECLTALYAMRHFRPYLISKKFTLQADHEPLNYRRVSDYCDGCSNLRITSIILSTRQVN